MRTPERTEDKVNMFIEEESILYFLRLEKTLHCESGRGKEISRL